MQATVKTPSAAPTSSDPDSKTDVASAIGATSSLTEPSALSPDGGAGAKTPGGAASDVAIEQSAGQVRLGLQCWGKSMEEDCTVTPVGK